MNKMIKMYGRATFTYKKSKKKQGYFPPEQGHTKYL
jgi:hypothetical protein